MNDKNKLPKGLDDSTQQELANSLASKLKSLDNPLSEKTMLTIKEIPQFVEYLTPEAQAVYKSPMHTRTHSFPSKAGGWTEIYCRYLGIKCDDPEPSPRDLQKLATWFNEAVNKGHVGWGCLAPAMRLPLQGGRCLLLLYTYSELRHDELNEKLGIQNFIEEGAIPPDES